jgi:arylsulfatase
MEFAYDGGGLGKGGTASLFVEGEKVAEGRVENTHPLIFSADSTASVGEKSGAPICSDFNRFGRNAFSGHVNWVEIELGTDDHDHYINQEDRLRIAMSLQ